jgi:hypothetical protein
MSWMTRIDNEDEGTMTWVETSLRYAHARNRSRLVELLETVRAEIMLEMKLTKGPPLAAIPGRIRTRP